MLSGMSLGFLVGLISLAFVLAAFALVERVLVSATQNSLIIEEPVGMVVQALFFVAAFVSPWVGAALGGDVVIRRRLDRRLSTTGCPGCGYTLVGQVPFFDEAELRELVRCPECGLRVRVGGGGIPRANLIHAKEAPGATEDGEIEEELAERELVIRYPALRGMPAGQLDETIARIEAGAGSRWRRALFISCPLGLFAGAGAVGMVVLLVRDAYDLVDGYLGDAFVVQAMIVFGISIAWIVGAWAKRAVRAIETGRAVARELKES